jgi:hypothetical protein
MVTVAKFDIVLTCVLDPAGKLVGKLPAFAENLDELKSLYRAMMLTRIFDADLVWRPASMSRVALSG